MNTVDVTVVGAGFNGIYTSWRLARDGISVALIDSSDQIGGVLRGKFWNDYWLDSGTHNFDMRTELGNEFYSDILQNNANILEDYDWASTTLHNWTIGFEMPDFSEDFPELTAKVLSQLHDLAAKGETKFVNDLKYIDWYENTYGKVLKEAVVPIVSKITGTDPAKFAIESRDLLTMFSRPKLGSDEEMIDLKRRSPFWDERLGVTYQCGDLRFIGKNAERKFCYPLQKGTQGFCESAAKRLKNLGVKLLLKSPISCVESTMNGIVLRTKTKHISSKKVIWTLPISTLAIVLGIQHNASRLFTPSGVVNHVFEVDRSAIRGNDYLHDYNTGRLAFRYNRAGIYGNQVKPDGRTIVMAEVPTHPKNITSLLTPSVTERVWQETLMTGFMATDSKHYKSTCWGVPNTFSLPNVGWNDAYAKLEIDVSNYSDNIHYIDLASRGRNAFMQSFENKLAPVLAVV